MNSRFAAARGKDLRVGSHSLVARAIARFGLFEIFKADGPAEAYIFLNP